VGLPSPSDFDWSPLLLVALVAVAAVMARRLRAAGGRAVAGEGEGEGEGRELRWRWAALGGALLLLAAAFVSPLATMAGHYLLTFHLVQVTLVMGFAPPLLLLALPAPPAPLPRRVAAVARVLVHPAVAIVAVNLVFFGWHAPVLYSASLEHPSLYALQQLMLFAVSLQFWWAIVEPAGSGPRSMSSLFKLGYILLATIPQTFAGMLFALARHTFYAPYAAAPRITGLDALGDQQLAGALMAVLSKLALFAAFSVILWRVLDAHGHEDEYGDDGGDGGDGDRPQPVLPGTPAWLEHLRSGRTVPEPSPSGGMVRRRALREGRDPRPPREPVPIEPAPARPVAPEPASR
jgi:putative membrane protein